MRAAAKVPVVANSICSPGSVHMDPWAERRVRSVVRKMRACATSPQKKVVRRRLGVLMLLAGLLTVMGICFDTVISLFTQAWFLFLLVLLVTLIWGLREIFICADVLLLRRGVRYLRTGNWHPLCWAVFDRPIRSRIVMSDPAVAFLAGNLLTRLGFDDDAKTLIEPAIAQRPELGSIEIAALGVVSEMDEAILAAGLDAVTRARLSLRILSHSSARRALLLLVIVALLAFWSVQALHAVGLWK